MYMNKKYGLILSLQNNTQVLSSMPFVVIQSTFKIPIGEAFAN